MSRAEPPGAAAAAAASGPAPAYPIVPPEADPGRVPPSNSEADADAVFSEHGADLPRTPRRADSRTLDLPSSEALEALADDIPSRLRAHLLERVSPQKRPAAEHASPAPAKHARTEAVPTTSDAFAAWGDAWDLDDSQLYSDDPVLLTSDAPPSSPLPAPDSLRTPTTPAMVLQQLLDALFAEEDECGPDAGALTLVARIGGDVIMQPRAAAQLHGVLRRCARETDAAAVGVAHGPGGAPQHLLDVDATQLVRMLALLERTMRHASAAVALPEGDVPTSYEHSTHALVCAECCLTVLTTEQLPRFVYSEDLVARCLVVTKDALETLVLPLVDACSAAAPTGTAAALAAGTPSALVEVVDGHFRHVCAALALLERLLRLSSLAVPDTLIITGVYLALGPFFVQERRTERRRGCSVYAQPQTLRPVRLSCLQVLRSFFACYPAQRAWVLSEILVSLLHLPDLQQRRRQFRLAHGRAVYVVTALLLQLLQAAALERPAVHEQTQAWLVGVVEGKAPPSAAGTAEDRGDGAAATCEPPTAANHRAVHALAASIAAYVMQKAAEAKLVKQAQDMSYATVVYCLMEDLGTLAFLPEWPAAPVLFACFCRLFVAALRDPKSTLDARAIALDQLGAVAARVRQADMERKHRPHTAGTLRAMADIVRDCDTDALGLRERAVHAVVGRLRQRTDDASRAAAAFHQAQWVAEVTQGITMARSADDGRAPNGTLVTALARAALCPHGADSAPRAQAAMLPQLVLHSTYFVHAAQLLPPILAGAATAALATRTRALRAVGNVAAIDPDLLDDAHVRGVVVAHLGDSSAAVRETCVAVLGAYVLRRSAACAAHYEALAARALDTAAGVRRRALRFLADAYAAGVEPLDAAARIVRLVYDPDPTLQAAAMQTLEALWLGADADVAHVAYVLAAVGAAVRERPSPLAAFWQRAPTAVPDVSARLGALVDELVGGLFADACALDAMRDRLRVVHMLVAAQPHVLTVARAKQLLPYVDGAETSDELAVMEVLLRIYAVCLPHMPRTAIAFATALEALLTRLISRCTLRPGSTVLEALVVCFCVVIATHTHNYELLKRTYATCRARLDDAQHSALVLCLAGLLCAYGPWADAGWPSPADELAGRLIPLASSAPQAMGAAQRAALTALGYVLRVHPHYFLEERLAAQLDALLVHGAPPERHLVLQILLAYLESEAGAGHALAVHAPSGSDVLSELTGTAAAYADSGVASALLQRYAEPVLRATLDVGAPGLQRTACEILQVSVLQGLSHPLQCVPYLVALETSDDVALQLRASQLHRHLVSRHASLLATRFGECTRASYAFQQRMAVPVRGVRGETPPRALLQTWYDLVRESRGTRLGFLRAHVRLLDVPGGASATEGDVSFARYVAENLAALDYRIAEEPLTVIYELRLVDAATGMQVLGAVRRRLRRYENERELSPLTDESDDGVGQDNDQDGSNRHADELCALARSAAIVRIAHGLRRHLMHLYSLPEHRCAKYDPSRRTPQGDRAIARRALADPRDAALRVDVALPADEDAAAAQLDEFASAADEADSDMDE